MKFNILLNYGLYGTFFVQMINILLQMFIIGMGKDKNCAYSPRYELRARNIGDDSHHEYVGITTHTESKTPSLTTKSLGQQTPNHNVVPTAVEKSYKLQFRSNLRSIRSMRGSSTCSQVRFINMLD